MAAIAPDLRPRGPAELYDAALHFCARGDTALPVLAVTGAALPAASGMALAWRAMNGKPFWPWAALFAACLMARSIFAGAASLAAEAALEAEPISAFEALGRAFKRAPALASAGGLVLLIDWVVVPCTLFLGLALWGPLWGAQALVAKGEAGPFSAGGVCRKRLGREPTVLIRILHLLALVVVLVNLFTGVVVALSLAHSLLALDVAFVERFASFGNGIYLLGMVAAALVLLEPVRQALGVLLLVDARVRSEGLDLKAAVDRLSARRSKGPVAAVVLLAALALPGVAGAALPEQAPRAQVDPATLRDLDDLLAEQGVEAARADEARSAARSLRGADATAFDRFVARVRRDNDRGRAGLQLKQGIEELREAPSAPPTLDSREAVRSILAQPEFDEWQEPKPVVESDEEGWFARLLKRLWAWLFEGNREPRRCSAGSCQSCKMNPVGAPVSVQSGTFEGVIWLVVGVVVLILLAVLLRALLLREAEVEDGGAEGTTAGGGPQAPPVESALSRPPEGWWAEADALARRGEFRGAVRALYLAVLAALHRRGAIEYEPARSNWDYVRAFKGGVDELPRFQEMTQRFDFAWYGRVGADPDGYGRVRELAQPILEREVRADA